MDSKEILSDIELIKVKLEKVHNYMEHQIEFMHMQNTKFAIENKLQEKQPDLNKMIDNQRDLFNHIISILNGYNNKIRVNDKIISFTTFHKDNDLKDPQNFIKSMEMMKELMEEARTLMKEKVFK